MPDVKEIIDYSVDNEPIKVDSAVNDILVDRIAEFLPDLKVQVAKGLFASEDESEVEEEEVEVAESIIKGLGCKNCKNTGLVPRSDTDHSADGYHACPNCTPKGKK